MSQIMIALDVWRHYEKTKPEIEAKYDTNNSGMLEFDQVNENGVLKNLLTDLNDGVAPPDEEVRAPPALEAHSADPRCTDQVDPVELGWISERHSEDRRRQQDGVDGSYCVVVRKDRSIGMFARAKGVFQ
eukprot:315949-Hanusia_phi.AAC.1